MKRLGLAITLAAATIGCAAQHALQHAPQYTPRYYHHHPPQPRYVWYTTTSPAAVGVLVGGLIGYQIAKERDRPIIIQQQPITVYPAPILPEYITIDGVVYYKKLINDNGVLKEVLIAI